ncbi:Positive regulator of purine utilization like protein [Verticillium longisporum]|uniref:Positive regulator of purine utilization like protein n=1 Tax=Verticillium longisporum TaxID=100787 RepID=A0A8I3AHL3_VERLO|nr:Positive regulator of purine utilization like protein [Verticillium longisporum]
MAAVEDDEPNSNSAGEDFVSSRPAKKRRHDTALNEAADPEGPAYVECLYDDRKNKPGLRTGAVENLSQRVATLESMFLGQGVLWQQVFNQLSSLTGQGDSSPGRLSKDSGLSLQECASHLKSTLSNLAESGPVAGSAELYSSQWPGFLQNTDTRPTRTSGDACKRCSALPYQDSASLPPPDLVDSLVDIYFANLHPWIPMLHVREFRERMADAAERPRLRNVFQAIVSTCARFADDARLGSPEAKAQMTKRYRQAVIVESMESFSVENLQALIICAFDTIGSGRGPSAWSIVGSMTRTVEQLQLSVEEDQTPPARALIKRIALTCALFNGRSSFQSNGERPAHSIAMAFLTPT